MKEQSELFSNILKLLEDLEEQIQALKSDVSKYREKVRELVLQEATEIG